MGCAQSKAQPSNKYKKNIDDLNPNNGISNEPVDSRIPFNAKEIFKLKSSWKAIHRSISETGIEMFIGVFRVNPDMMKFFQKLSNIEDFDENELRKNEALQEHAEGVMGMIDEVILNISDVDKALATLHKVGKFHRSLEGYHAKLFWAFEQPFLDSVSMTLGDRYSDYIATLYEKTIKFVLSEIEVGFNS